MDKRAPDPTLQALDDAQLLAVVFTTTVPVAHRIGGCRTPGVLVPAMHARYAARACERCFANVPAPGHRNCARVHAHMHFAHEGLEWQVPEREAVT